MDQPQLFEVTADVGAEKPKPARVGESRLLKPNRGQMEYRLVSPDGLIPANDRARGIVGFVDKLDFTRLRGAVQAKEGQPGRPAIDPALLLSLWIQATTDGIASARELEGLCRRHVTYQWICGGVEVSAHTLSDFRSCNRAEFDRLLTDVVAVLMKEGLVELRRAAQDGMRVRASAGAASFRRAKTLEECLKETQEHLAALRMQEDDGKASKQRAAQIRGAEDRERRVQEALRQLPAVEALKAKKRRKDEDPDKNPARVSTTDPEARVMKMPDGGFRPAYNVQMATDTKSQVVLGVSVTNEGTDHGQMAPMVNQLQQRYEAAPAEHLVDGGFVAKEGIDAVTAAGVTVYAPVTKARNPEQDQHEARRGDSEAVAGWRARMATPEAKEIYKDRGATAECVNAIARKNGLTELLVRGVDKVLSVALLIALTHNVMRALSLGAT